MMDVIVSAAAADPRGDLVDTIPPKQRSTATCFWCDRCFQVRQSAITLQDVRVTQEKS